MIQQNSTSETSPHSPASDGSTRCPATSAEPCSDPTGPARALAGAPGSGLYAIASGIPIPEKRYKTSKYPFSLMAVGDSFFVPIKEASPSTAQQAAQMYAKRHPGYKFVARTLKREGGTRIWCIASPNK